MFWAFDVCVALWLECMFFPYKVIAAEGICNPGSPIGHTDITAPFMLMTGYLK